MFNKIMTVFAVLIYTALAVDVFAAVILGVAK